MDWQISGWELLSHSCKMLWKAFGLHDPQLMEREEDAVYFSHVFHTNIASKSAD